MFPKCWISVCSVNMVSVTRLFLILLIFFTTVTTGEKKKINKIVIHVPYKIHKHHHTHTKYKVITIPAPKKENTVIYLKEEIQPVIKHVPNIQTDDVQTVIEHVPQVQTEEIVKPKVPEFIPPHQQSAASYFADTKDGKQQEYSTILDDQKSLESGQHVESFVPQFTYKPVVVPSQNFIPNYSFKPFVLPQHDFYNPIIHQSYNTFIPKYSYQPMLHYPQKFNFKPALTQTKPLQDSVAHTSSHTYKTIINPKPKTMYKVKEEIQESIHQPIKPISNPVPSLKHIRKGKSFAPPAHKFKLQSLESLVPTSPDYEYEHVGYLIIDGNSKKIVGKNFKDEINLIK